MLPDYYMKAESQLGAYRRDIERWREREMEKATSEVKRRYYEEIQGLESKCSAAEIALNACKFAEQEDESLRQNLEDALEDIREAMARFRERFSASAVSRSDLGLATASWMAEEQETSTWESALIDGGLSRAEYPRRSAALAR